MSAAVEYRHVGSMVEWICRGCLSVMQSHAVPAHGDDRCSVCRLLSESRSS